MTEEMPRGAHSQAPSLDLLVDMDEPMLLAKELEILAARFHKPEWEVIVQHARAARIEIEQMQKPRPKTDEPPSAA